MSNALSRFRAALAPGESALVCSSVNRRYLTGFASSDGFLLVTPDCVNLFLDSRYFEMAEIAKKKGIIPAEVELMPAVFPDVFGGLIEEKLIRICRFEDTRMTVAQLEKLKERFAADWQPLGTLIEDLRQIKEPWEIERIAAAQALSDRAFLHILDFIRPGRTEIEVAAELEYYMKKNGASKPSFETICVSGTKSSLPHGKPEARLLEENSFLTMDFGALLDGYCADMTRTVCLGRATDEMKKVYDTVLRAHLAGIAAAKAGKTGAEVDAAARDLIRDEGYGEYFGHGTGHSIGLEVHEPPNFSPRWDKPIPAGTVLSVEPGIYLPGRFGVRIEDLVAVNENGCRSLNTSPKELIEI